MTKFDRRQWLRAIGTMIGSIVGVGVLGLPFSFNSPGPLIGVLMLVLLTVIIGVLFLMFAEITVQTKGKHRFVTYVAEYLGQNGKWLASITYIGGAFGALTAFIIVGGDFLNQIVRAVLNVRPGIHESFFSLIVFVIAAYLIFRGLKFISKIEIFVIIVILALYASLILFSVPSIEVANIVRLQPTVFNVVQLYGVVLFALAGMGAVPEMHDIMKNHKHLPSAVVAGFVVIFLLYGLFALAVTGASGSLTSQDAITGLINIIDTRAAYIGMLVGLISILSIFTILGITVMETFQYDFKMPKKTAWAVTMLVPLSLFLLGVREFISVVGFVGAVFGGTSGILVALAYEKLKKSPVCRKGHKCWRVPSFVTYIVILTFVIGILTQVLYNVL